MAVGQEGPAPLEPDEPDEDDDDEDDEDDEVFVVGVAGTTGTTGGTTMATHAVPFQTCPAVQMMQVTPLKYELGGQVATQFPL